MTSITLPLVGSNTSRDATNSILSGSTRKDQYALNAHFDYVVNNVSGKQTIFVSARQEYSDGPQPSGGSGAGTAVRYWRDASNTIVSAFGNTNSTIWYGNSSVGTITGQAKFINEVTVDTVSAVAIPSTDRTLWFYCSDAGTGSPTFTGDLNSSTSITNVVSTAGLHIGQLVTHANIPANTRITNISGTTVTIENAATATAAGQTITRTPIAKVYTSNYPGNSGGTPTGRVVYMDGYTLIMSNSAGGAFVYNSNQNATHSGYANQFVPCQESSDSGVGIAHYGRYIVAFGKSTTEFFYNAGNSSGSILSRVTGQALQVGCVGEYAYTEFMGTVAFVGVGSGVARIYILNGLEAKPISDPQIDTLLSTYDPSTVRLNVMSSFGMPVLVMTLSAPATTLYVWDQRSWHLWTMTNNFTQSDVKANSAGGIYVGSTVTTVVLPSNSVSSATFQTGRLDLAEGRKIALRSIELIGDIAASALNVSVAVSYDDSINYSAARTIDVSQKVQKLHRLGFGKRPNIKISGLSGVSNRVHRLEAIKLTYDEASVWM